MYSSIYSIYSDSYSVNMVKPLIYYGPPESNKDITIIKALSLSQLCVYIETCTTKLPLK